MKKEEKLIAVLSPLALFSALPCILFLMDFDILSGFVGFFAKLFLIGFCTPCLLISFASLWQESSDFKTTRISVFAASSLLYGVALLQF